MVIKHLIELILILPILGIGVITLVNYLFSSNNTVLKTLYLFFSTYTFIVSCKLWVNYLEKMNDYNFIRADYKINFMFFLEDSSMHLGLDGISLFLVILTTFIFSVCSLVTYNVNMKVYWFIVLSLVLEFFVLASFLVLDFLMFYVFFEAILIPMFLMIGI